LHRSPNKPGTSPGDRISNRVRLPSEPLKIPVVRHITDKIADVLIPAIGFRNRLLSNRLSALAEACQVLFLFTILFFDGHGLRHQIMIGWARESTIVGADAFRRHLIALTASFSQHHLGGRGYLRGGNCMGHTMREVAKRAGVSPATVSRVLNKTRYISVETERRVLEVVGQMKYFKNVHARRLATGRSDLFGLVISEIANPYFPEIIRGFQAAAWDRGFDVLLCNTQYDQARTKSILRKLIESDVRGVAVMTSSIDKSMAAELIGAGIGVVFCNVSPAEKLVSTISIDYQRGIAQAIEHIVGLGHRRAAVIAGPDDNRTAITIKDALVAGLKKRNLNPMPVIGSNYRIDAGASAVRAILSMPEKPTVIFCGSDLIALGAMSALEEAGVGIPEDISVIGIDDISFAFLARPPLTTIRVPRERVGTTAFEALDRMLKLKRQKGSDYYLETELVVRGSTATGR
jgi:DNA-binding LacI/PurR family transcriptional regulator